MTTQHESVRNPKKMLTDRLRHSKPIFVVALLAALSYWFLPIDFDSWLGWQVVNGTTAVVVAFVLVRIWHPQASFRRHLVVVLIAAVINVYGVIHIAYGSMFAYFLLDMLLGSLGMSELGDTFAQTLMSFFVIALTSACCAVILCFLMEKARVINGVRYRTYKYCAGFCFLAALPYIGVDFVHFDDSVLVLGAHKGLWSALFGLALCLGVSPETGTPNATHAVTMGER